MNRGLKQGLNRAFASLLVCLSVAACASGPGGGDMASSAFDYAPTRQTPAELRHGYELGAAEVWTGEMIYEDRRGEPRVMFVYDPAGGDRVEADLAIAEPYLQDGRRRFIGEADDGRAIEVVLQAGPCRESAGGDYATHFAAVIIGGVRTGGCGYEVAASDRWSNYLMDYLPAIDVCLAEFPAGSQHVSVAYPMGDATGVRVIDDEGMRWECVTRDGDRAVNSLRQLDAADIMFGEGDPIFVRSRMPQMGEGCYVYEAVRREDGALIGALGYDGCGGGAPVS